MLLARPPCRDQVHLIPGSGHGSTRTAAWLEWEAGLHGFLSLLSGIYESCCEVRCEPHGKFQLHSRKCIHCGLIGGHLLSLGYARPTWSPRQMRRQGFQTQGVDVIGAERSLG